MRSIFGVPWAELDLQTIEHFLEAADEEPLLWEAKEGARPESVRKHVSGFANRLGGWLILGAEQRGDGWTLPGMEFRDEEPQRWLSDVITALRPVPLYDIRTFPTEGKIVAVVQVEQIRVPPCVTPSGTVFQRVSGKTMPITEPLVLLELLRQGEGARADAERRAGAHTASLVDTPPDWPLRSDVEHRPEPVFALALAAAGPPPDIASRPFDHVFGRRLREDAVTRLDPGDHPALRTAVNLHHSQGAAWTLSEGRDRSWLAFAHWDGTVAVGYYSRPDEGSLETLTEGDRSPLSVAWHFAADQLAALGCFGETRLNAYFNGRQPRFRRAPERFVIQRALDDVREPTEEEYASVVRELGRAVRLYVPEPASA